MTKKIDKIPNKIRDMIEKLAEHDRKPCHREHCSACLRGSVEEWEKEFIGFGEGVKRIEEVGKNPKKSAIEKKTEIFDILLKIDFGKLSASENERTNILLKSHFHGELAKKYLKDKEFSNN